MRCLRPLQGPKRKEPEGGGWIWVDHSCVLRTPWDLRQLRGLITLFWLNPGIIFLTRSSCSQTFSPSLKPFSRRHLKRHLYFVPYSSAFAQPEWIFEIIKSCPCRTEEEPEALGTKVTWPSVHSKSVAKLEDHPDSSPQTWCSFLYKSDYLPPHLIVSLRSRDVSCLL